MIAGQNIIYYPGSTVFPGGYLHGYIAPSGPWCGSGSIIPQVIPNSGIEDFTDPAISSRLHEGPSFNIYPNPTSGSFTIELEGIDESEPVNIVVYSMQGDKVYKEILEGTKRYNLSLAGQSAGLYFVRIVTEGLVETVKVIKL